MTDDICIRQPNPVIPESFREQYKGLTFRQAVRRSTRAGSNCPWKGKERPESVRKKISKSVTAYYRKRKEGAPS